jgi:hypothetical protein
MKRMLSVVFGTSILVGATACAQGTQTRVSGGTGSPSASPATVQTALVPHVSNWERFFKVDWRVAQEGPTPVVQGRVYNDWGLAARDVRLLVEGIDANGRVRWQRIEPLTGDLTPGTAMPFVVRVDQPAPAYRVSVYSFDWVQSGGGERR